MATIVFSDIEHKVLGEVAIEGDELVPSNTYAENLVAESKKRGQSTEFFVNKYSEWTNGYYWAEFRE